MIKNDLPFEDPAPDRRQLPEFVLHVAQATDQHAPRRQQMELRAVTLDQLIGDDYLTRLVWSMAQRFDFAPCLPPSTPEKASPAARKPIPPSWSRSGSYATLDGVEGASEVLAGAIRYTLSHWEALTLALHDGRRCLDYNAGERVMRPVALGRKNWRFAGSDAGGGRPAAIYTLTDMAKLNDLDLEDYLRQVLGCVAEYTVKRDHGLLSWNLATARARCDQQQRCLIHFIPASHPTHLRGADGSPVRKRIAGITPESRPTGRFEAELALRRFRTFPHSARSGRKKLL